MISYYHIFVPIRTHVNKKNIERGRREKNTRKYNRRPDLVYIETNEKFIHYVFESP